MSSRRKVLFYTLSIKEYETETIMPGTISRDIFNYINGLEPLEKQLDLSSDRFCQLESANTTDRILSVLFKSAKNQYRAPLLNRVTGTERPNPKALSEGERVKTHAVIKFSTDEVLLCVERGGGTLTINQIINYLNSKADLYHASIDDTRNYSFDFEIIAEDNFLTEVRSLDRVIEGELYIDKNVLGGEALEYSERTTDVKQDLKLIVKAERGRSITDTIVDVFNVFNSARRSTINRIRVKGKDEYANEKIIDSDIIAKMQFVDTEIHVDTGEINSDDIFRQMRSIIRQL